MNDDINNDESMDMEDEEFAAMFEASLAGVGQDLVPGAKVAAKVLQSGSEWTFLDVGQKGEGVLATAELLDGDGNLTAGVGDSLTVYFLSRRDGELRFTTRVGGAGSGTEQLQQAYQAGIPVEGRINKEIKGGYEVSLSGNVRAFCPFSQAGLRQIDPAEMIGQNLSFRMTQFDERGRNIVVSHRVLLDEERAAQRESLRQTLKEGQMVSGTVTNLLDFGAFIDIGGIEGLLPISEISYGRVDDIEQVLQPGQQLDLIVKRIDWVNNRFSFSLRDTLVDPWLKVGSSYQVGGKYPGTVGRLAQFGAFVTLEEGIDGLLHISKMGEGQRVRHPQDLLKVGQQITVTIEKIDADEKRISLALAGSTDEVNETSYSDDTASSTLGTLGELLKAGQQKKERRQRK